jgi:O-antigen/teichoic acid export membrane protein
MVNNETEPPRLKGWLTMSLGLLAMVIGGVWTLQGLGYLDKSLMTGQTVWAAVGGALIVVGLLLVVVGMRRRSRGQTGADGQN